MEAATRIWFDSRDGSADGDNCRSSRTPWSVPTELSNQRVANTTMPPTDAIERPQSALRVARRYHRRERLLNAFIVVFAVSLFLLTYVVTTLLPAVVVAAALVVIARAPILQSKGTVRLRTDDDIEAVLESFTGPTPPVLALQWGVADAVTIDDGTPTYPTSYLFGLRSVTQTVDTETTTTPDGAQQVEVAVQVNGNAWATYTATLTATGDRTTIDVEYTSNRRFGLRRVPQQLLATRYRDAAIVAQGYTVVERDAYFGL